MLQSIVVEPPVNTDTVTHTQMCTQGEELSTTHRDPPHEGGGILIALFFIDEAHCPPDMNVCSSCPCLV